MVVVGQTSGEGADRPSLALAGDQDMLVSAVAAANPRTIVVLNTPGAVLMPWLGDVAAVLQAWYPGETFGEALAAVLFGDAEPGGRLPATFPASDDQGPTRGPDRYPGIDGVARYDEGVEVGYRWFDAHGEEPLFPFGHGLTYTEFRYGDLRARRDEDSGNHVVAVEVENARERAGSEVVQLYVAMPPEADAPPRQLAGFRKLRLEPGERAEATFELTSRELAAYDEEDGRWVVRRGRYGLFAGASSRDIRAQAEVEVDRSRTV